MVVSRAYPPKFIAYVDSSKGAVGGTWITILPFSTPFYITWKFEWPTDIINNLISDQNKQGNITINDLEMAGVLLAWLVLEKPAQYHLNIFIQEYSVTTIQ